jgi:hypothetical protein
VRQLAKKARERLEVAREGTLLAQKRATRVIIGALRRFVRYRRDEEEATRRDMNAVRIQAQIRRRQVRDVTSSSSSSSSSLWPS